VYSLHRVKNGRQWQKKCLPGTKNIEAARGNIFSVDGSLLATSVPEYELRMDMLAGGIADDKVFDEKIDSLSMVMSKFFGINRPASIRAFSARGVRKVRATNW
jgi:cell division protein FtsI (penicillin-binding protein 3)